jgi:hypothetical protein
MKTVKLECEDGYEAEKLASLLSVQKDGIVYVDGVAAAIGNEIVIKLKDKSSHAVLLKNRENVEQLKVLLFNVVSGNVKIRSSCAAGSVAEITLF